MAVISQDGLMFIRPPLIRGGGLDIGDGGGGALDVGGGGLGASLNNSCMDGCLNVCAFDCLNRPNQPRCFIRCGRNCGLFCGFGGFG